MYTTDIWRFQVPVNFMTAHIVYSLLMRIVLQGLCAVFKDYPDHTAELHTCCIGLDKCTRVYEIVWSYMNSETHPSMKYL